MTDPREVLREQVKHLGPHRGAVAEEALALVDNLVRAALELQLERDLLWMADGRSKRNRAATDRFLAALAPFVAGRKDTAA